MLQQQSKLQLSQCLSLPLVSEGTEVETSSRWPDHFLPQDNVIKNGGRHLATILLTQAQTDTPQLKFRFTHVTSNTHNLHNIMSCVLSEELAPTPLEAVQVMMAKALSLITLMVLSMLMTLKDSMVSVVELVMIIMTPSSAKSVPFMNQEMVGAGTPVAVHISAPEAPSEMITVGFWEAEMAASGGTGGDNV